MSGYSVRRPDLRRQAGGYAGEIERVQEIRDDLRAAFARDRRALGSDAYGAELEKNLPAIEEGIFTAFKDYLDELDGLSTGLFTNARIYDAADEAWGDR